ncbi:MAG: ATP-binding protein [Candidatus Bathyarchaeia archaeon]
MELREYLLTKKDDIRALEVKERLKEVRENKNFVVAVVGPRRAGKTYFLYSLIRKRGLRDEDYLFVNFEENVEVKAPVELPIVHQEVYGKLPEYIFFDEVQALGDWQRIVYTLYEKKRYYLFITGSSSKLLSKEIATQLRGRAVTTKIYPFSFKEILSLEGIESKKYYSAYEIGRIKNLARNYVEGGSFPDIVLGHIHPSTFFKDYLDLIVYRDIVERYGVKNRYVLEFFMRSAISSSAKIFSVNKVFDTLKSMNIKVSKKTLYNFQKILEDVGFAVFLRKIGGSLRKAELTLPKVYPLDNGVFRFTERKLDLGRSLEAAVLQELCKDGLEPNSDIFYWRDSTGKEVDFILRDGAGIKQLVQVVYASSRSEIGDREVNSLLKASNLLKCKNLLIVTWDYEEEVKFENKVIRFSPFWKWLLDHPL